MLEIERNTRSPCVENCFLKQVIGGNIEGRIEVKAGGRGRRNKQLLDTGN